MEDTAKRLQETTETCFNALEAWTSDKKSGPNKENLNDSLHELRKVLARIEIDMALSESKGSGGKIPIPSHRANQKHQHETDDNGNGNGDNNNRPRRKRNPRPKKDD